MEALFKRKALLSTSNDEAPLLDWLKTLANAAEMAHLAVKIAQ